MVPVNPKITPAEKFQHNTSPAPTIPFNSEPADEYFFVQGRRIDHALNVFYALVFLVGVCGNTFSIRMLVRIFRHQKPSANDNDIRLGSSRNLMGYLLMLCVTDLVVISIIPLVVIDTYHSDWTLGQYACKAFWLVDNLNKIGSKLILMIVMLDKLVFVLLPVRRSMLRSKSWRAALFFMLLILGLTAVSLAPVLRYSRTVEMSMVVQQQASVDTMKTEERVVANDNDNDLDNDNDSDNNNDVHAFLPSSIDKYDRTRGRMSIESIASNDAKHSNNENNNNDSLVRLRTTRCVLDLPDELAQMYTWYLFAIGFCTPTLVILVSYAGILCCLYYRKHVKCRHLQRSRISMKRVLSFSSSSALFYLVCWTPYWIFTLNISSKVSPLIVSSYSEKNPSSSVGADNDMGEMSQEDFEESYAVLHAFFIYVVQPLVYVNSALNWLPYIWLNSHLRLQYRSVSSLSFLRHSSTKRNFESFVHFNLFQQQQQNQQPVTSSSQNIQQTSVIVMTPNGDVHRVYDPHHHHQYHPRRHTHSHPPQNYHHLDYDRSDRDECNHQWSLDNDNMYLKPISKTTRQLKVTNQSKSSTRLIHFSSSPYEDSRISSDSSSGGHGVCLLRAESEALQSTLSIDHCLMPPRSTSQ